MKKFIILLIAFSTAWGSSYGYSDIRTRLYVNTKLGYSLDKLVFGLDSKASNSLDTALGESEIPPIPPPEGVHGGFEIYDTNQKANIFTFVDLRPYPLNEFATDTFHLRVWKGAGDLVTFSWNPLWPEILSAHILDAMTGGKLININMKDSTKALISNEFIESFLLIVKYDPQTSVNENSVNNSLLIYPQPANNEINFKSDNNFDSFRILNLVGMTILQGKLDGISGKIALNALPDGIYFIELSGENNRTIIRKFIRQAF